MTAVTITLTADEWRTITDWAERGNPLAERITAQLPASIPEPEEPEGDDWIAVTFWHGGSIPRKPFSATEVSRWPWATFIKTHPDAEVYRPESRLLEAIARAEKAEAIVEKVRGWWAAAHLFSPDSFTKLRDLTVILEGGDA